MSVRPSYLNLLVVSVVLAGCTEAVEDGAATSVDGENDSFEIGKGDEAAGPTAAEEAGILLLVNTATLAELDVTAGLDGRAASGIVRHRDGADGRLGTADDDAFDTLAELDAVPYVGPVALTQLLTYARQQGLVTDSAPAAAPCLIISEYMEGQGINNKAVELYNCGSAPLALNDYGICLVRNGDTDCSLSTGLAARSLAPGEVFTTCRTRGGTLNDPYEPLRAACQQEIAGVATFSGDDRLLVFQDTNHSQRWERGVDVVVDMLGRFDWRPRTEIWADTDLRRCRLAPYDGTTFYTHTDWFTVHRRTAWEDLGRAPVAGCR